ncbi:MAG: polyprenyl synthetase family protein [Myxococcota bacterium]
MPFARTAARRALAEEVERIAGDLRVPLGELEDALAALVGGEGLPPGLAPEVLFEGGVPRLRPVLVVLASRAAAMREADAQAAFEVVAIAEMLQGAILLHDAALGRRDGRRRRVARRVLRGATTWLGANHLTLRALELARRAPAPEVMGEALDALRDISETHALGAQLRERAPTPAEVLQHAEGHSGALMAFACRAAGHVAGAGRAEVTNLGRYGRHVGVALCLAEDLALFERRGHSAFGRELARAAGRPVFPVAAANARDPSVDPLWRLVGRGRDPALAVELADRVYAAGGLVAGREALVKHAWEARRALAPLPDSPARDSLDRIAASLARAA